jgi:GNAT superfamily N-acetyltransferase
MGTLGRGPRRDKWRESIDVGLHDVYGKQVLHRAAGVDFWGSGPECRVDLGAGPGGSIDGVVRPNVVVEIEARVAKQVRGALLDLICHPYPKKLLLLLPVHAVNPTLTAAQCRAILGRFLELDDFRVVVLSGKGGDERIEKDAGLVRAALAELGKAAPGSPQIERVAIRSYRDDDRPVIEALFDEFQDDLVEMDTLGRLRRPPGYGATQITRSLRAVANHGRFLVAEIRGEIAGFVVGTVRVTTPDEELEAPPTKRGRVEELYVRSGHRSSGVGQSLMSEIEKWFRTEGCDVLRVEVFAPNDRARKFYERLGYVPRDIDQIKLL